jgi:hypothetical protein
MVVAGMNQVLISMVTRILIIAMAAMNPLIVNASITISGLLRNPG